MRATLYTMSESYDRSYVEALERERDDAVKNLEKESDKVVKLQKELKDLKYVWLLNHRCG